MFNSIRRAIRLSRQRSREDNALPFSRQLWEMALLQLTTKLGPGNYHKYRLWQKDIPWEEKKGYWHDQKYYGFLNKVNPYKYRIVARNKVLAKALLQFYSIPDARYLGYLSQGGSFASDGSALTLIKGLEQWIGTQQQIKRLCFKPVEGSGGDGFCAVELIRSDQLMLASLGNGKIKTLEEFVQQDLNNLRTADYIMEEYIEQHPVLAEFNPSSLNTVRVWVGKTSKKGTEIVGIYLRVGRQGSLVDNRLSGGFGVEIDQNTFRTKAAIPQDGGGQAFKGHPDSGFNMTDIELPFRSEVIELSKRVINILPSTRFVGLDIAFSTNGPVIIEFNLAPTAIGACVLQKSHQQLLGWILED